LRTPLQFFRDFVGILFGECLKAAEHAELRAPL